MIKAQDEEQLHRILLEVQGLYDRLMTRRLRQIGPAAALPKCCVVDFVRDRALEPEVGFVEGDVEHDGRQIFELQFGPGDQVRVIVPARL